VRRGLRGAAVGSLTLLAAWFTTGSPTGSSTPSPVCPVAVAHRGASDIAPEETLTALVAAAKTGAAVVEWDIQWTRAGGAVLMHDATVDRTTNGTGAVSSLWWSELKLLDAGAWFDPAYSGLRIPDLKSALRALARHPGTKAIPELKGTLTDTQLRTLAGIINDPRNDMAGRVIVQSFSADNLRRFHAVAPMVPLALTTATKPADPVAAVRAANADWWLPDAATLTAADVDAAHAAGIKVMPWTVDDPAGWERLTVMGVDGVLTNRPGQYTGWAAARCG